jgi:ligand-binding sensor domain-containing protein/signal transduction histidine kinase
LLRHVLPRLCKLFLFKWFIGGVFLVTACGGLSTPVVEDVRSEDFSPAEIPSRDDLVTPTQDPPIPLPSKFKFENISVDQGLSQSSVYCILQDSKGLMWFGTEDGLNRYDGYNFTVFKHDPDDPNSLSSNFVLDIYEDWEGKMWVGTQQGLDRYDRESDQWSHFPLDQVRTILEDNSGVLWVGSQAGLYSFDKELDGLKRQNSDRIYTVYQDSTGTLWVGTDRGFYKVDEGGDKIVHYQHSERDPKSLVDNLVRTIFEDHQGRLWIGTSGGLDRFDRATETFTHFQYDENDRHSLRHNDVWAIYEDLSGVLWVGTDGGGLDRFDPAYERFIHYQNVTDDPNSLSSNMLRAISQDRGGVLWIGTNAGGISKVDVAQKGFTHYQKEASKYNTLSHNLVLSFFEDYSQILWIGTGGGGLNRFDRHLDLFTSYRHDPEDPASLSDDFVTSVYVDREGVLWAGTARGGLNAFDRFTGGFTHFVNDPADPDSLAHNTVWVILEDRQGTLWIGTGGGGLDAFVRNEKRFDHYSGLSSNFVSVLYEDQDGQLWVGTDGGGINKLDRQNKTFTHYTHDPYNQQSLSSDNILAIYQDGEGDFWIGTNGGGLNKFDPQTNTFSHYRERDGLPNDVVYGILGDDEGMLWLSTNKGLSRFDPRTGVFRNYDVRDGLQSNEFNANAYFKNQREEMFFGGVNGFNVFKSDQIQDNPYQPPIVLTSLTQAGGSVDLGRAVDSATEATFYWPNNFFEFEFAALSYSHPEKNQYAFMLEGFRDEDWNYIGTNRFGRYTNIPGGIYTLRLKGSNQDGIWNEAGTSIKITVIPPIWGTWWFQGMAVLILVAGIFAGFRLRVRNIQTRTIELENQVANRTRELEAINAIASVVSSSLNLERILKDALDKTLEVVQVESGGIYLFKEGSDVLTIHARKGLSDKFVAEVDNLMIGEGFSGQVVQSGESLVVADVSSDPRLTRTVVREEEYHALVVLPLVSRGIVMGTMFLISHNFREFSKKEIEMLNAIGGQIGGAVENARFFEDEHRRSEQFRVLSEVGSRVSTILDVNEVLEEVVRLIQSTFDYYHVAIGLIEGDEVVYRVGSGELWDNPKFGFKPARLKIGREGLSGWVAANGQPVVLPDVSKEPRYVWMHGSKTRSEITVPIIVKGQVIGVLDVQSDQLNAFDETDLAVLQSLAHQAGAAIENARLYEQAQQAAVLEERARLARDLHDAVTQTLFSASLLAEALPASWEKNREEGQQLLEELKQLNRGALAEMRTLLIELRPAALLEAKLGDLLNQLAEAAGGREGLSIDVTVDCECFLPPDVHIALYRIAQEALNNVLKHARASEAHMNMSCSVCESDGRSKEQPKKITLVIKDNGHGFDQDQLRHDHLGLGIMQERAKDIGAQLNIESKSETGTSITVIWEVDEPPEWSIKI